jgi:hypothetical protein
MNICKEDLSRHKLDPGGEMSKSNNYIDIVDKIQDEFNDMANSILDAQDVDPLSPSTLLHLIKEKKRAVNSHLRDLIQEYGKDIRGLKISSLPKTTTGLWKCRLCLGHEGHEHQPGSYDH